MDFKNEFMNPETLIAYRMIEYQTDANGLSHDMLYI